MADLSDVRFLTVAEVAEMMRVSNMTVYRMVAVGQAAGGALRALVSASRSRRVAAAIELPDAQVG